ncbi:MAG: hypothetical protein ACUVTO_07010 [Candidatus Caldatribacteriaceae bacterium]
MLDGTPGVGYSLRRAAQKPHFGPKARASEGTVKMKKRKEATVKKELLRSIFILSSMIILAFGSLASYTLYLYEASRVSLLLKEENAAAKSFLEARFIKMLNMVEFLSDLEEMRNAPSLDARAHEGVLRLYRGLETRDSDISHIYSGYRDGLFLTGDSVPRGGLRPRRFSLVSGGAAVLSRGFFRDTPHRDKNRGMADFNKQGPRRQPG